ncbi:MAG: aminopeptidase P family protein [Erysipelotrichaceae bacterium]|nr:aminopeptidase P family protein [Erysipelotrichaceae bacterium]
MLDLERNQKVRNLLQQQGIEQMLVSDPLAVFYLTGKWIFPGERFMGLILKEEGTPTLIVNALSRFPEEIGVKKVYYNDGDDINVLLKNEINEKKVLGVDKNLPARFLLPMGDAHVAEGYRNGSFAIDDARAIKDEAERQKMRVASLVNDKAMAEFKKLIKAGVTEEEVAAQCLGIYKSLGASGYSFHPIVAFGRNAADPHHGPDSTVLKEGDTVLFDVGCKVDDYCSDMTRVFYYKREPDALTRKIYDLVRRANEEAEAMLKPGIPIASIDKKARDIITEGGYGKDFTHRLGHFIGIETHDFGDVSQANPNFTKPGNTFSIEPGIYNVESGIGVRIEDLVLITEDGAEVLNHYTHDWEVID